MTGSTTALNQDVGELLNLLLGTTKSTETLLGELTGTLVLVVLEQLHATLLVGSETGDFADEVTDELDTLAEGLKREDQLFCSNTRMGLSSIGTHGLISERLVR